MVKPGAIILAGGQSKRFGQDKLQAKLLGKPVLHYVIKAALEVAEEVLIVGRQGSAVANRLPEDRVSWINDVMPGQGPLQGLVSGLDHLNSDMAFILAGDMPLITPDSLTDLITEFEDRDDLLCYESTQIQPLFSLCKREILSVAWLLIAEGRKSVFSLLDVVHWRSIPLTDMALAEDIDTPADLEKLSRMIRLRSC